MRTQRGFALAVFLALMPVVAIMAWTFLKVGSVTRAQAIGEERAVRALHAAEAGIRSYIATGQPSSFELNDCQVQVVVGESEVVSRATPKRGIQTVSISLELDRGFVTRRRTNEEK